MNTMHGGLLVIGATCLALLTLAACGAGATQRAGTAPSATAAAGEAIVYCDQARKSPTAVSPLPVAVTVEDIVGRQRATVPMAELAPAELRDDFETVLTSYETYIDTVTGDAPADRIDLVQTPAVRGALWAIETYGAVHCGIRDIASLPGRAR